MVDDTLAQTGQGKGKNEVDKFVKVNDQIYVKVAGSNSDGSLDVVLKTSNEDVSIQNPLPTDGDSVYKKDIDEVRSITTNWTGNLIDLFGSLILGMENSSVDNPKNLTVFFNRVVTTNAIGLGAETGSFSNVKIIGLTSGGTEFEVFNGSADNTSRMTQTIQIAPIGIVGFRFEFHTANTINISNIVILKTRTTVSRIEGQKPDKTITPIGATKSGNLKTTDAENGLAIAKGEVAGTTFIHKFGDATAFDIADGLVSIWDGANTTLSSGIIPQYTFSTSADIDSISSTSVADTQIIEVQGLDLNYNEVTQTVTLTGQTTATLTTPLIRAFRMINRGSVDLVGEIYLYTTGTAAVLGVPQTPANVRAIINDGNNQTLMSIYTIPASKTGYMRTWFAATSGVRKTSVHVIHLSARPFGEVFQLKHVSSLLPTGTSTNQHRYEEPEVFTEKTDIIIHANTDVNAAAISAGFDIVLVDN